MHFIRVREPEASERYEHFVVDSIAIYIYKEAKLGEKITFKMAEHISDLADREIDVEGISI